MKAFYLFCLLMCSCVTSYCNDSLVHQLLLHLNALQVQHDPYFPAGLYPCYRQYAKNRISVKKDDNIFYTGLVGFTLRRIRPQLNAEDKILCDSIFARIAVVAPKFKNQKGRETYNFWRTDTTKVFPNSGWINMFDKVNALADDFDDTNIMMMVLNQPVSVAAKVHMIMQDFVNGNGQTVKTALRDYKNYAAYSTWFGKKMVIELDACILSNTLYMVQNYNLAWTKADSTSLDFLVHMIEKRDYMKHPGAMSVYYVTSPIILYHLARLMSIKAIPELEKYRHQLISDAMHEYAGTNSLMEKVILRTALLQWGTEPSASETIQADNIIKDTEQSDFVFFIANLACTLPGYLAYPLVNSGITKFYFYCPAYNDALLLEYIIEQKKYDKAKLQ